MISFTYRHPQAAAHEKELARARLEAEEAQANKVNQSLVTEQSGEIKRLQEELNRMAAMLEEERARSKEITESILSLKSQEVDQLQSKIQESFGFVPSEPYVGMTAKSNPPALLAVRQQLEGLARMTAKKSKDEGVYAFLDFLLRVREVSFFLCIV